MKLSIIIPCFNEESTIVVLLDRIDAVMKMSSISFEIIVVDDGSTDRSAKFVQAHPTGIRLIKQENKGKGAAVKAGVEASLGEYVLIQDADLEYHPSDIPKLFKLVKKTTAVYGSRMLKKGLNDRRLYRFPKDYSLTSRCASVVLSLLHLLLYGKLITDTLTGYKIYHRQFYIRAGVSTSGFETDHELTAKLIRGGFAIVECPIQFTPRTVADGKKINIFDFFKAVWVIIRFRFA